MLLSHVLQPLPRKMLAPNYAALVSSSWENILEWG